MAMLADRRRKQKLIPSFQGNISNRGTNTFGQKLMERMGWSEGKGLGRNEDGMVNHIKVSYKNDTNGMGFKETDQSAVHQDDFNSLLKELSNSSDDILKKPRELKSLEEKSQNSRARVHYKKFTRGKDLSRCSEKDLANIFGKKKLQADLPIEDNTVKENGECKTYGVQIIPGGSMVDYFKNKFSKFGNYNGLGFNDKREDSEENQIEEVNDTNIQTSKKSKKKDNETFVSYVSVENESDAEPKKKKRKRLQEDKESSTPKKCKKDKQEPHDLGLVNPAFEPLSSNITIKKHILTTINENDEGNVNEESLISEEQTKKKKKCKFSNSNENLQELNEAPKEQTQDNLDEIRTSKKKSKLKVKNEMTPNGLVNPAFQAVSSNITMKKHILATINENDEANVNELPIGEEQTKKKKKCKLSNSNENIQELNETPKEQTQDDLNENTTSKKKSKRKVKNEMTPSGLVNPAFESLHVIAENESENTDCSYNNTSLKKKKKKSKSNENGIENPSFAYENAMDNSEITTEENPYEEKPKKKKKKKKQTNESDSMAIDNPTFNINGDFESSQPSEQYEVKRKSKKSCKGLDNPALNLNDWNVSQQSHDESVINENKTLENATDNSIPDISDCDIMINVVNKPILTSNTPKIDEKKKNVRFKNVNQHVSPQEFFKRKSELFDINTKVIQEGLRNQKKGKHAKLVDNPAFDIQSVDKIDFCNDSSSTKSKKHLQFGQDNHGFDAKAQRVEESVNQLTNSIDHYQAEIENGINESKLQRNIQEELMVGEINNSDGENEPHSDGIKLRFKYAKFSRHLPQWAKNKEASLTWSKKSYKHLIRGDIVVGFKNSNLHKIDGYGLQKTPGF